MKNRNIRQIFSLAMVFLLVAGLITPYSSTEASTQAISVADAIANNSGNATVEGYIVGTSRSGSSLGEGVFEGPFTVNTNVLIADNPNETDISKTLPVQLPNTGIRVQANLVDNPSNLGAKVQFTGNLEAYFSKPGLRSPTAYELIERSSEVPEPQPQPQPDPEQPPVEEPSDSITVAQAIENNSGTATVEGYIVGTRNVFEGPFTVATNIQIADHPHEKALVKTLPVQLPAGAIRNSLNLVSNPDLLGKKIRISGSLQSYFSVPGLQSPTSFEILADGEIPELIIPEVSLKQAREMIGQTVITEGVVNVDNGLLQPGRLSVYIQDEEAGIQLFAYQASNLKAGDRVKVKGKVGEYNAVTQIEVEELEKIESGQAVALKEVEIADYLDTATAESYEGQLVTFSGFIYSIPAFSGGGANLTVIDENLNVLTIRVWESTGIDLSDLTPNKWYNITAISSQYRNTYQVLPRSTTDFVKLDIQKEKPFSGGKEVRATVERVVDGDTVRLANPVFGALNVRFLNIDTLETYHSIKNDLDQNQMDHGKRAGEHLRTMLADGDEVILRIGEEPLDSYGRLLAEVLTLEGVNTNYEMVKAGHAVTYFIWPFESDVVAEYGQALKEAKENELGIWNPADPMLEYPFEFRARERGGEPSRPVGDYRTKYYVPASEWRTVEPEYRVFFHNEDDALAAGYRVKPVSNTATAQDMKTLLAELHSGNEVYERSTFNVLFNHVNKIEKHLEKMESLKNPRAAEAHYHNFVRAVGKLDQDLKVEYQKNNMSEKAYQQMLSIIEAFDLEETEQKQAN